MSLSWDLSDLFSCQWLWENVTPVTGPDSSVSSLDWGGGSGRKTTEVRFPFISSYLGHLLSTQLITLAVDLDHLAEVGLIGFLQVTFSFPKGTYFIISVSCRLIRQGAFPLGPESPEMPCAVHLSPTIYS